MRYVAAGIDSRSARHGVDAASRRSRSPATMFECVTSTGHLTSTDSVSPPSRSRYETTAGSNSSWYVSRGGTHGPITQRSTYVVRMKLVSAESCRVRRGRSS